MSIEPERSMRSWIEGVVGVAAKCTAGQFASGPGVLLPLPLSMQ